MREELKLFLGAAWGECTPERKGYRNGTYTRDLATSSGLIEDLEVPRDREGHFQTQVFDRYARYEPQVAEGLTQMFVAGVSTQKVGEVAQTLMGVAPSASSVSRLNQNLTEQFETWRERALQAHWRIVYLDGVHFQGHHLVCCVNGMINRPGSVQLHNIRDGVQLSAWCLIIRHISVEELSSFSKRSSNKH
jgi:transposase-like protein